MVKSLVIGMVIGGAIALLFAPKTGKETRQIIKDKTIGMVDTVKDRSVKVVEAIKDKGNGAVHATKNY